MRAALESNPIRGTRVEVVHLAPVESALSILTSLLASTIIMGTTTTERPLPELSQLQQRDELDHALSLLLEPTPTLHDLLVPQVLSRLETINQPLDTYSHLIELCLDVAADWTYDQKAQFVQGHPKIGAPAAKISALSGKEQSAGPVTPPVVLERFVEGVDLHG
jgi:hypothetical protein